MPSNLEHPGGDDWPWYVPFVCVGIVGATIGYALTQERYGDYQVRFGVAAAALILLPFVVDAISVFVPRLTFPLWLFPIPVLIGMTYFVYRPADTDFAPFVLVFMAGELVSRSRTSRFAGLVATVGSSVLMILAEALGPWMYGAFIWVAGISFGAMGGYLVRLLDIRTHELEEAQAGLAAKAAADERSRIAREVHDVIAHSLSVTMLHVTAARMALEKGDRTADAVDALREAEDQGRRSLQEVRRTVGLLGPDESAAARPMPLADDLPSLVGDFRNAGLPVTLRMDGDIDQLPPNAGLALYRIVQESLTNVVKHAPGASALVELDVSEDEIKLRVHNSPSANGARPEPDGSGLGLRGMTERAALLGGSLHTRNGGGGWTVELRAPRPTAEADDGRRTEGATPSGI